LTLRGSRTLLREKREKRVRALFGLAHPMR